MITRKHQSGFTIIESLIAILVVSVLMAAIAPVIALSVSNRVQSRRVELATQSARAYVDGVRAGAIAAPSHIVTLNEVNSTTNQFSPQRGTFSGVAAPASSGSLACTTSTTGYPYCQNTSTSSLYCFDLDSGGCSNTSRQDLVVQAFRSVTPTSSDAGRGYLLGVRVYRADAFTDTTALKTQKQTGTKQTTFITGLGNRKASLVEITTEVNTAQPRLQDFCNRLGGC